MGTVSFRIDGGIPGFIISVKFLPARVRINTSRGSFHHMIIKSVEKHSKSLIYRAKQTKEREQYITRSLSLTYAIYIALYQSFS